MSDEIGTSPSIGIPSSNGYDPKLLDASLSDPLEPIKNIKNSKLPDIVYTVRLEPFFNIMSPEDKLVDTVEIDDLPQNVKNTLQQRLDNDFKNIVSQTLSYQYKVSSYNYNDKNNVISIDFIIGPKDIKNKWIPLSEGTPVPPTIQDLVSNVRNDIMDQIEYLYDEAAYDTWKKGELNMHTDDDNNRYDLDLRLLSTENFLDWNGSKKDSYTGSTNKPNVVVFEDDMQPENQSAGSKSNQTYYQKYMMYKEKYLSFKGKNW